MTFQLIFQVAIHFNLLFTYSPYIFKITFTFMRFECLKLPKKHQMVAKKYVKNVFKTIDRFICNLLNASTC